LEADELDQLRNFHKFQAIQELEVNNKEADFKTLHEKTGFPKPVLEDLYANFREELYRSDSLTIGFEQFVELFKKHHPPGFDLDVAFVHITNKQSSVGTGNATASGDEFTNTISSKPLTPGELTAILRRLFKLFDESGSCSLSFLEYVLGLDIIYNGPHNKREKRTFQIKEGRCEDS
jgi:hypothetical protein